MPEKIPKGKLVIRAAKPKDIAMIPQEMRFILHSPKNSRVFVALHAGKIVGACECGDHPRKGNTGVISEIAVLPGYKRLGIGHKLLGRVNSYFESRGISAIKAATLAGTRPFFAKAGYAEFINHGKVGSTMGRLSPRLKKKRRLP